MNLRAGDFEIFDNGVAQQVAPSQPFLREMLPWTEAGREPDVVELVPGGLGSRINDGIVAALMTPGRRQVVAALIAGPENGASVDSSRVRDLGGHVQVALFT